MDTAVFSSRLVLVGGNMWWWSGIPRKRCAVLASQMVDGSMGTKAYSSFVFFTTNQRKFLRLS
jgi:hypothetical protein